MFLRVFPAGPIETNAILLACEETKKAAVIDAPLGCTRLILEEIRKRDLQPQIILFTHSHWDHIADAAELKKNLAISVYAHREDAGNLEDPGSDGLFSPIEGIEGVKVEGFLEDGQKLQVGKIEIEVIYTPGHTPGGVCFWMPQEKVLISGDTLFRGGIGKLSLPTSRPASMRSSLKKLGALPAETRVIPGHGPETTIGREKRILEG